MKIFELFLATQERSSKKWTGARWHGCGADVSEGSSSLPLQFLLARACFSFPGVRMQLLINVLSLHSCLSEPACPRRGRDWGTDEHQHERM